MPFEESTIAEFTHADSTFARLTMTTSRSSTPPIQYSPRTVRRAERAVRCAPFLLPLYEAMRLQGVSLKAIAGKPGVGNGYTCQPIREIAAENQLLWLIQVGLLRREVDGQGLTDSFRLTPLGHQLVEKWRLKAISDPSWGDRLYNALSRWVRLPGWMQL
jgi:hypothetical protein